MGSWLPCAHPRGGSRRLGPPLGHIRDEPHGSHPHAGLGPHCPSCTPVPSRMSEVLEKLGVSRRADWTSLPGPLWGERSSSAGWVGAYV